MRPHLLFLRAALAMTLLPGTAARSASAELRITSANGTWQDLCPPPADGHGAVLDPTRHRMIVFGSNYSGYSHTDVLALSTSGPETWGFLPTTGGPSYRGDYAAIYDPVRDRYLMFGGDDGFGLGSNEVWALSLSGTPTWTQLFPSGTAPASRLAAAAIYDPVRDRMIVTGGMTTYGGNFYYSDTWAISLAGTPTWIPLASASRSRAGHTAVYDSARDRMLVYGGENAPGASGVLNDVVAFDLAGGTWSPVPTAGGPPEPRTRHTAAYDPARDRMVIAGGTNSLTGPRTWALSLASTPTWSALDPGGEQTDFLYYLAGAYDASSDAMLLYDGHGVRRLALGAPTWSNLNPAGPTPTAPSGEQVVYDWLRDRWLVLWGSPGPTLPTDTWALSLVSGRPEWSRIDAVGARPTARTGYAAIYDAARDRIVLFGGGSESARRNDVWALSLSGTPAWSQLAPAGVGPAPCEAPAAVYDAVGDRMIIWGGYYDGFGFDNATWVLSLAGVGTWSTLPGPAPPGRFHHTATLDYSRGRMLVFGGEVFPVGGGSAFNDTWALPLTGGGWESIGQTGGPSARASSTIGYDAALDRMIVLGGLGAPQSEAWALTLGTDAWSQLAPSGVPPRPIATPGGLIPPGGFDPVRRQMVVCGAAPYGGYDLSTLSFADGVTALEIVLVHTSARPGLVRLQWHLSSLGAGMASVERRTTESAWKRLGTVMISGDGDAVFEDRETPAGARFEYRLVLAQGVTGGDTWVDVPGRLRLAVRGANPTGARISLALTLPESAPARLELVDAAGRQLLEHAVQDLEPGSQTVVLAVPAGLRPGIYWVRLTQSGMAAIARVAFVR